MLQMVWRRQLASSDSLNFPLGFLVLQGITSGQEIYVYRYFKKTVEGKRQSWSCARHEGMWGNGGIAPLILNVYTKWAEWSVSCPYRFIPGKRARATKWIEDWVGPKADLDVLEKRIVSSSCQELNRDTSVSQPVICLVYQLDYVFGRSLFSNLNPIIVYPEFFCDFIHSLQASARTVGRSCDDCFFPNYCQLFIPQSSCHMTLPVAVLQRCK